MAVPIYKNDFFKLQWQKRVEQGGQHVLFIQDRNDDGNAHSGETQGRQGMCENLLGVSRFFRCLEHEKDDHPDSAPIDHIFMPKQDFPEMHERHRAEQ